MKLQMSVLDEDTTDTATSRRDMLHSMLSMTSTIGILSSNPSTSSAAASSGGEVFVGKYSDPNNHPGGTRTVKLLDGSIGDYQLAEVRGGGGLGEPKDYTLPAMQVPPGHFLMFGDNRNRKDSYDSHSWLDPFISEDQITGCVIHAFRYRWLRVLTMVYLDAKDRLRREKEEY